MPKLNRQSFIKFWGVGGLVSTQIIQPFASYPRGARRACCLRSLPSRAQARQTLRPRPRFGGVSWRGLRAAVRSKVLSFAYNINRLAARAVFPSYLRKLLKLPSRVRRRDSPRPIDAVVLRPRPRLGGGHWGGAGSAPRTANVYRLVSNF